MNTTRTSTAPATRGATPTQLSWLRSEVAAWHGLGLVDQTQAQAILATYHEEHRGFRLSLGRILLSLGGAFIGIGLIWLVAANLDELSPLVRFVLVGALWAAFLVGSELLARRPASRALVGAIRLLSALAFGALIFQAAQSLQVPAFEPLLVGVWAAGALVHAYVVRAFMPFLVGVVAGTFWWIAQPIWIEASGLGVVVILGAGAVLAAGLAVLHDARLDDFAWMWRLLAALLALAGLFAAAIPDVGSGSVGWSTWLVVELVAAGAVALVAVPLTRGPRMLEPLGALLTLGVALGIAAWTTGTDTTDITTSDWGHAVVSVLAYVLLAVAIAALGTLRDHDALTWLAMAGLVVFTTFQSFAVFAPIVTGAWLFVVLGTVFLGTGYLFDRARRGLAQAIDSPDEPTEGARR